MNIDKQELRIAIAEKMGWTQIEQQGPMLIGVKPGETQTWPVAQVIIPRPPVPRRLEAPRWTTDLTAAWQLVEWMRKEENGKLAFCIESINSGGWWVMFHSERSMDQSYPADDEKPEMAICLAFAKANSIPIPQLTT